LPVLYSGAAVRKGSLTGALFSGSVGTAFVTWISCDLYKQHELPWSQLT
jgi:hypothetical protein